MPQDQQQNPRPERPRAQRPETTAGILNVQFGDVCDNIKAGLQAQKQMMEVLHDVSHAWFTRATSQTELAFKLPQRLTVAQNVPDVLSACQQWATEWIDALDEDRRGLLADSKKIVDQGVRYLTMPSPSVT